MKKIVLTLLFILLLSACGSSNYVNVNDEYVDGYIIYHKENTGFMCSTYYDEIYYSGPIYNYGFRYKGCSPGMAYYIRNSDGEYIYLHDALEQDLITLESLMPVLSELERIPEEISSSHADYYWMDFHIGGDVIYVYAGGECDQAGEETFFINGDKYTYSASGCLQEHIIYMNYNNEYTPIIDLIESDTVDPLLLIPFLTKEDN